MFLRKLFNISDKIKWLALELLVVFIGVYLAFVFQNISLEKGIAKEQEKVFVSLKKELDYFRIMLPEFADFQENIIQEWDSLVNLSQMPAFYGWRYIEPQYNFKVIEYAVNLQGTDIIDFEMYELLLGLYQRIKNIEHAERLMTDYAGRYRKIPKDINQNGEAAKILIAENELSFYKFKVFARDRTNILKTVANSSAQIVELINIELGPEKTKTVDFGLLKDYLKDGMTDDYIFTKFLEHFPQYSIDMVKSELEVIRN